MLSKKIVYLLELTLLYVLLGNMFLSVEAVYSKDTVTQKRSLFLFPSPAKDHSTLLKWALEDAKDLQKFPSPIEPKKSRNSQKHTMPFYALMGKRSEVIPKM